MSSRSDNFNRADGAIGTPSDGGSAWVQESGTWAISTNRAHESAVTAQAVCSLQSSASIVDVQATMLEAGGLDSGACGLVARVADDSNYLLYIPDGRLYKKVGGGFTLMAGFASTTISNGDVLKLSVDGSNLITGYNNGSSIISTTDSAGSTNTKHGIRTHNESGWYFDTFSITDNGGGGGGTFLAAFANQSGKFIGVGIH